MSHKGKRKAAIDKIILTLKQSDEKNKVINRKKLLANISYEHSCTMKTASEYLEIAERMA